VTVIQRITREPNLILGVVTAGLSLAVIFGVDLSAEQVASVGVFIGAIVALVRFITTPADEVAAQITPGNTEAKAGPAAKVADGTPVEVITHEGRTVA
jgi:hypothetical protein